MWGTEYVFEGWGCPSVVEHLPSMHKIYVPSSAPKMNKMYFSGDRNGHPSHAEPFTCHFLSLPSSETLLGHPP
jgi:hypothetical protein